MIYVLLIFILDVVFILNDMEFMAAFGFFVFCMFALGACSSSK